MLSNVEPVASLKNLPSNEEKHEIVIAIEIVIVIEMCIVIIIVF